MTLKNINLALRFVLELGALAAVAYWGFRTGDSLAAKVLLGLGLPLLMAVVWGTFRVPNDPGKAPVPVLGPVRLVIEALVFGLAAWCLANAGRPALALVFAAVVVINYALMPDRLLWLLRQR